MYLSHILKSGLYVPVFTSLSLTQRMQCLHVQDAADKGVGVKTVFFPRIAGLRVNPATHTVVNIVAFSIMEQWTSAQRAFPIRPVTGLLRFYNRLFLCRTLCLIGDSRMWL
jgi:hypothetical protein